MELSQPPLGVGNSERDYIHMFVSEHMTEVGECWDRMLTVDISFVTAQKHAHSYH